MRWIQMLALSAFAMMLAPVTASACGNEVRLSKSDEVKAIVKAEAYLEKRQYRRAVRALIATYRYGPMSNRGVSSDWGLRLRMQRVAALVGVRAQGAVSLTQWSAKGVSGKAKQRQLRWSAERLRQAHLGSPDDPARAGQYAEALAALGKSADALAILEPLAKADLIVDAETWKVLADLRAANGDKAGTNTAKTRCEATAIDRAICRPTT